MARYISPDAGAWVRLSYRATRLGNTVPITVTTIVSGVVGVVIFLPLVFVLSIWYLLPIIWFLILVAMLITYGTKTDQFNNKRADLAVEFAQELYQKCRGTYTEQYALPLMRSIYGHALSAHENHGTSSHSYSDCKPCYERRLILKELIPNDPVRVRDDIEQAKLFIQARKEIGS